MTWQKTNMLNWQFPSFVNIASQFICKLFAYKLTATLSFNNWECDNITINNKPIIFIFGCDICLHSIIFCQWFIKYTTHIHAYVYRLHYLLNYFFQEPNVLFIFGCDICLHSIIFCQWFIKYTTHIHKYVCRLHDLYNYLFQDPYTGAVSTSCSVANHSHVHHIGPWIFKKMG